MYVRRLTAIASLTLLAACGGGDGGADTTTSSTTAPTTTTTTTATTTTAESTTTTTTTAQTGVAIEDDRGNLIELDAPAQRVVCLTGICVDSLFLLDVVPVAANDVLHFSPDYFGPEAAIGPISGSFFEPSIEDIVAAEPDLVIGLAGVHDGLASALGTIPVMITDPIGVEGAKKTLRDIATLVDKADAAEDEIAGFDDELEHLIEDIDEQRSSIIIWTFDGVSVGAEFLTAPSASLLDSISDYTYRVEVEGGQFPVFTLEELLDLDPEVIFASVVSFGGPSIPLAEQLADDPVWSQLSAVQAGEVHDVPFDLWSAARGLRSLSLILDFSIERLYPDLDHDH